MPDGGALVVEEARIRAAFAQRGPDPRYAWSTPAYVYTMQSIERRVLQSLAANGMGSLAGKRVLEVGCGTGHFLREFVKWGARPDDVVGVDLLSGRVDTARDLCSPGVQLICGNGISLPLPDASFEVVAQFTVFTSIQSDEMKRRIAREMVRVTKRDGVIIWYDFSFNNPGNAAVKGIGGREVAQLFPECSVQLQRVTLAPPLVRSLAPYSWLACSILEAIPLLRTHLLGTIKKNGC